jgi:hypothetical protein
VNSIIRLQFFKIGFENSALIVHRKMEVKTTQISKPPDDIFDDGLFVDGYNRLR